MAALGFTQHDREAAASEAEALRDRTSHSDLGAVAGHAVSLAVNPDLTCTVVHLIDPGSESSERTADSSTDGNFPPSVPPRITKDSLDAGACRTRGQEQRSCHEQQSE